MSGRYRTVVADPPWQYQKKPGKNNGFKLGTAEAHYSTLSVSEIRDLPVRAMAAADAHLYMWVTNPVLTEQRVDASAVDVVRGWGFIPKTIITWVKTGEPDEDEPKPSPGMGWFFRGATEHVIFAVRGNAPIPPDLREPNVFYAPRGRHSEKPDVFVDMVERLSPAPYVELFARRARFGWDVWGDESLGTAEFPEAAA